MRPNWKKLRRTRDDVDDYHVKENARLERSRGGREERTHVVNAMA